MESDADNNGGATDYYDFDPAWKGAQDVIEAKGMNFSQGTIFKCAYCFNTGRHEATNAVRELNKIIWYANRELVRLEKK